MSTINKRLRSAREESGYRTAVSFARAVGVGEATYRHHENGTGGRGIPLDRLNLYAKKLGLSVSWLINGEDNNISSQSVNGNRQKVHVIILLTNAEVSKLAPKVDIEALGLKEIEGRERVYLPVDAENAAAMEMPDDSMSRLISCGEKLVVNFNALELDDMRVYLINMNGTNIVRRYRSTNANSWFEADSFQHSYDRIEVESVDGVLGRVIYRYAEV